MQMKGEKCSPKKWTCCAHFMRDSNLPEKARTPKECGEKGIVIARRQEVLDDADKVDF